MKNRILNRCRIPDRLLWKCIILFFFATTIPFCTPDPSNELLKNYSFSFPDNGSIRLLAGESANVAFVYFSPSELALSDDSVKVFFDVEKGGGSVNIDSGYAIKSKPLSIIWQLGNKSSDQILRASVYDLSDKYLSYTDMVAYGFRTGEWDAITAAPDNSISDMVSDTVNNFTLAVSGNILYRQGDVYYRWNQVLDPLLSSPRTIDIDRKGVIYVSTWNGDIIKSSDHGSTWSKCTKPYSDGNQYINTSVANDNSLWAFRSGNPTRFSADGGVTWTDAGSGLSTQGYGDIFRLKNGSLLFHGSNCCSLCISADNGLTWTKIVTPGSSLKVFANELDEVFLVTRNDGIAIYKSVDYGNTFIQKFKVYTSLSLTMGNTFIKWKDFYYVCLPGYGILKTYDLENYEIFWLNNKVSNLFIDNNGVLIAKDLDNSRTIYYRKNSGI